MIKAYAGQEIHSTMIDALVAQEVSRQKAVGDAERAAAIAKIQTENEQLKHAQKKYHAELKAKSDRFKSNPKPGKAAAIFLGIYGLIVLCVSEVWWFGKRLVLR